jgi:hypothetical protein
MTREELKSLWQGRYVENYPEEFFALIQEVEKVNPLKTIIEIGVKHCGTLRVWEHLLSAGEGLLIGVDFTPLDVMLSYSGKSTKDPKFNYPDRVTQEPGWDWNLFPCDFIKPADCATDDLYDPEASSRQVHFAIGDSNSVEVHNRIAYLLGDRKADMVFHDGGHFGDIPRKDFENIVFPFLRPGGLFVLADLRTDGVALLRDHLETLGPVKIVQPDLVGFVLWNKPV